VSSSILIILIVIAALVVGFIVRALRGQGWRNSMTA
jgi:hypothetical protein